MFELKNFGRRGLNNMYIFNKSRQLFGTLVQKVVYIFFIIFPFGTFLFTISKLRSLIFGFAGADRKRQIHKTDDNLIWIVLSRNA